MTADIKNISVQTSYCLDLICFIDLLCQSTDWAEDERIAKWEEYMSDEVLKHLNNLKKLLEADERLINTLAPLLVLDDEFNDLKVLELLKSPRYLLTKCKQEPSFKSEYKAYKTTILKRGERLLRELTPIVTCLERFKFKQDWIETRLPLINTKMRMIQKSVDETNLASYVSNYSKGPLHNPTLYVLSYYDEPKSLQTLSFELPRQPQLVSVAQSMDEVAYAFIKTHQHPIDQINLKKPYKRLKKEANLKKYYQIVKSDYQTFDLYLNHMLDLAITSHILAQATYLQHPSGYLARYQYGTHKFSVLLYDYLAQVPREKEISLDAYFTAMLQATTSEQLQRECLRIISAEYKTLNH